MKINIIYLIDESPLANIFKNNITHLALTIDKKGFESSSTMDLRENLLKHIFDRFTNLIELDFNQSNIDGRPLLCVHRLPSITCYSTSLIHLSISVHIFDDCLCLLDGRLPQLRKLCVLIEKVDTPSLPIENLVRDYISINMLKLIFQYYCRKH